MTRNPRHRYANKYVVVRVVMMVHETSPELRNARGDWVVGPVPVSKKG